MSPILHTNFRTRPWVAKSPFRAEPVPGGFDSASITVLVDGDAAAVATLFAAGTSFPGDGVQLGAEPMMYSTGPQPGMETMWGIQPGSDTLSAVTEATISYKGFLRSGGSVWYGQDVIVTYAREMRDIMFPQGTDDYTLYGGYQLEPVGTLPGTTNSANRYLRNRPGGLPPGPFHVRVRQPVYTANVQGVWRGSGPVPKQAPLVTLDQPPSEDAVTWANVPDPVYCQDTGWQAGPFEITSELKAGNIHLALWRASFEYIRPRALA